MTRALLPLLALLAAAPLALADPEPAGIGVAELTDLRRRVASRDGDVVRTTYLRGLFRRRTVAEGVLLQLADGVSGERLRFGSGREALEYAQQLCQGYVARPERERRAAGGALVQRRGAEVLIVRWRLPEAGLHPDGLAERVAAAWSAGLGPAPEAAVATQGLFVADEAAIGYDPRPAAVVTRGERRGRSFVYRSQIVGRTQSILLGRSEASLARLAEASDRLLGRPFLTSEGFASRLRGMLR